MSRRSAPLVLRSPDARQLRTPTAPSRRPGPALRRAAGIVALVSVTLLGITPVTALAAPGDPEPDPIVFEGGTRAMREQLDETQTAWLDAKVALDASVVRQKELATTLVATEEQIGVQTEELGKVARLAFESSGPSRVVTVFGAGTTDAFLDGMGLIEVLALRETNLIENLVTTRAQARAARTAIEQEVETQNQLLADMDMRKQQAQLALCQVSAGCPGEVDGGFRAAASYVAVAAPRNSNGSWPAEYIPRDRSGYPAVRESTVTGSSAASAYFITPRTAHMVRQSRGAGFRIYVACYGGREDGGQHPRGRACDFALDASCYYCAAATGAAKRYGDDLAAFLVFNAERLGVLYVIWYKRIWLASTGQWKAYSGAYGDPSSNHTNHVHVSMR